MAFTIVRQIKAWWPISFAGVTEAGDVVTNSFRMRFLVLDEDAHQELERDVLKMVDQAGDGAVLSALAADVVERIAEDWEGVTIEGDNGEAPQSLPFNRDNILTLVRVPNAFMGIVAGYRACRAGQPETRRGN